MEQRFNNNKVIWGDPIYQEQISMKGDIIYHSQETAAAEDTFQPEQPVQQCLLFTQLIRFQHQRDKILVKVQLDKINMYNRWGGPWPHYQEPGTGQHGQLYFELHVL